LALLLLPPDVSAAVLDAASGKVLEKRGAVDRRFAPGSAIKPFTALALGEITLRLPCPRDLTVAGRNLRCSHPRLSGPVDLAAALAYSCNHYFVRASSRLDPERFTALLRRFGFDVPTPATADELALTAVGLGGVRCSTLELARAYRMLSREAPPPIRQGIAAAVEAGTSQLARPSSLSVAGKTGTGDGHAWFAGWAPADAPRVILAVSVPGGRGAVDAAPAARALFERHVPAAPSDGLRVRPKPDGPVQTIPLERYVSGVVTAEGGVIDKPEALKALAVAARTYAVCNRGRHKRESYDLCGKTHCQALKLDAASSLVADAVAATEGELLWYEGRPAEAFHSRHCGGTTASVQELWPEIHAPYLKQQPDTFCLSTDAAWTAEFARTPNQILRRTPSGRVAELMVNGRRMTAELFHKQIGDQYGWARVRSFSFEIVERGDKVVFEGRGYGHGVGLCQAGAAARARAGHTYRQILGFYYPGTTVALSGSGHVWIRSSGARVAVSATTEPEARQLAQAGDRALEEAERRTGWRARARPEVRSYLTVAAFRDATGLGGSVAASTRGKTVRLQPVGVLRSRGILESTLLHEMTHVLVEAEAHPSLPGWFREGVVLWLSGTPANTPEYRDAVSRVRKLAADRGRDTVLRWVRSGLPK
jgi:stage II sporulation protein D